MSDSLLLISLFELVFESSNNYYAEDSQKPSIIDQVYVEGG